MPCGYRKILKAMSVSELRRYKQQLRREVKKGKRRYQPMLKIVERELKRRQKKPTRKSKGIFTLL